MTRWTTAVLASVPLMGASAPALGATHTGQADAACGRSSARQVVSPLPGTPDASPATQISVLGPPACQITNVIVVGSKSGRQTLTGRPHPYSSGAGASFFPRRPFKPGETVAVRIERDNAGRRTHIAYRFAVAVAGSPSSMPLVPPAPNMRLHAQSFVSRPDLHPTVFGVTRHLSGAAPGDVFVAPIRGPSKHTGPMFGQYGPLILDDNGRPLWFDPAPARNAAFGLRVQTYRNAPVLTWWQGRLSPLGVGSGQDIVLDSSYRRVAVVRAGNGLQADLHEFVITSRNTALITAYEPIIRDLRPYGGAARGVMWDAVVQEVDIATGRVMYEWHALRHVSLRDSYQPVAKGVTWDPFHLNSIQESGAENLMLSFRDTWTGYAVAKATGAVIWRLGGKRSTFALGRGVHFAWQHDFELRAGNLVSLFDNESGPPAEAKQSRGELIKLDFVHKAATLARALTHSPRTLVASQGNTDVQPDGNALVGWGAGPFVSEFAPSGKLLFDGRFVAPVESYRAYRHVWSGHPLSSPALAVKQAGSGHVTAYASWNGATDVVGWQLLAGASSTTLQPVGLPVARGGFETAIVNVATTGSFFAVQALRALPPVGQAAPPTLILGTSKPVR